MPEQLNPVLQNLLEKETVELFCLKILKNYDSTIFVEGIQLLSYIIETAFHIMINKKQTFPESVTVILSFIGPISEILNKPPKLNVLETTYGTLNPPLGLCRLRITEFLVQLYRINSPTVEKEVLKNKILQSIINIIFRYDQNTFLHNLLVTLIQFILDGESEEYKKSLIIDCQVCLKIINEIKDNEVLFKKSNINKGNIGHLVVISNKLETYLKNQEINSEYFNDFSKQWKEFTTNFLTARNSIDNKELGGPLPGQNDQNHNDDIEKHFQDSYQEKEEEFGDEDFMKSNDDEDELVKKEHGSDEDDEDETLVRHVDEKKDNIIIQKDLKRR